MCRLLMCYDVLLCRRGGAALLALQAVGSLCEPRVRMGLILAGGVAPAME